jgi:hypothetical protein
MRRLPVLLAALGALAIALPVRAQQADQTVINLSTTRPLKAHGSYFRLTHRFARDLGRGDFGQLAEDLFSLDNGAIIGLEYRYGITRNLQAGIHRTILGKTIVAMGRWDALAQDGMPLGLSFTVGYEGQNNLRQDHQPSFAATASHVFGSRLAVYASPTYVHNAHTETLRELHEGHAHDEVNETDDPDHSDSIDTFFVGLAGRFKFLQTAYLVGEVAPRVSGYRPNRANWNVGVEKETHGHVLQLNFGNNFNTTPGQIARGGDRSQVFMGFNLSRRF